MDENTVEFEEDANVAAFKIRSREILGKATTPTSVRYLVSNGVVKTEGQAVGLILTTVLLFLGLSGWIISASLKHPANLYVTDRFGREIPFEQYVENIRNGDDPLNYKN